MDYLIVNSLTDALSCKECLQRKLFTYSINCSVAEKFLLLAFSYETCTHLRSMFTSTSVPPLQLILPSNFCLLFYKTKKNFKLCIREFIPL